MRIDVRLRQVMKDHGDLSVPKLAEMTGINPPNIYSLLKRPSRVHLPTLAKLCEVLNLTPADLLVLVPGDAED
jgi:DNA-binding Xre family transcriptional regulator